MSQTPNPPSQKSLTQNFGHSHRDRRQCRSVDADNVISDYFGLTNLGGWLRPGDCSGCNGYCKERENTAAHQTKPLPGRIFAAQCIAEMHPSGVSPTIIRPRCRERHKQQPRRSLRTCLRHLTCLHHLLTWATSRAVRPRPRSKGVASVFSRDRR
jgi:hypothetical protein